MNHSTPSAREAELLDRIYSYVLENGILNLSLRPLAAAVGSSPRVLLYLFGSKEGLIRTVLARARADELRRLEGAPSGAALVREVWAWLADDDHRRLLELWFQTYILSVSEPDGPWQGFAHDAVTEWLALLSPDSSTADPRATLTLAVIRGAMLDLIATGEQERITRALEPYFDGLDASREATPLP